MVEELTKISLDTHLEKTVETIKPKLCKTYKWKLLLIPVLCIAAFLIIIAVMLLPLRKVIRSARIFISHGRSAATAIKNQDIVETKAQLAETRKALQVVSLEYKKVTPLKYIPVIGLYIKDGEHAVNAALAGLDAADKAIEALEPNADLLGFTGKSSFVSGTADERMQTAVKTMDSLIPKISEMAQSIDTLRKELSFINLQHYPQKIGSLVIRGKIESVMSLVNNTANLFVNAQPLLMNLPKLLGEPEDMRYLVLFQNDKELRPTGGFITAYAQFRFSHGKAILEKADDIYNLDNSLKKNFPATREIKEFHRNVYNLYIRDSNLSPDFKKSMTQFEEMYAYVSGREDIDGIWAVDTHVLVETLKVLGPTNIYGREFSADIDSRCDCPKAVYELEDYATRPVGYVRDARKDIIGVLFQTLLKKALGVSPSQYWGKLFQVLITEINEKHVLAYFHDPSPQKAAESFNLAGRIMTASETATLLSYKEGESWDYLHINNSNMAGAKANMFTKEKVLKEVTENTDGTITTKLSIEYSNPYQGSDCGLESGGLCLNAPLRNWVRIYVPKGSVLQDSRGTQSPKDQKATKMSSYEDLDKTVFEGFLIVNPLQTAKLECTYTSPVKPKDGKYNLLIQKQPGTDGQEYTVNFGGKKQKPFLLQTDTEIVL